MDPDSDFTSQFPSRGLSSNSSHRSFAPLHLSRPLPVLGHPSIHRSIALYSPVLGRRTAQPAAAASGSTTPSVGFGLRRSACRFGPIIPANIGYPTASRPVCLHTSLVACCTQSLADSEGAWPAAHAPLGPNGRLGEPKRRGRCIYGMRFSSWFLSRFRASLASAGPCRSLDFSARLMLS